MKRLLSGTVLLAFAFALIRCAGDSSNDPSPGGLFFGPERGALQGIVTLDGKPAGKVSINLARISLSGGLAKAVDDSVSDSSVQLSDSAGYYFVTADAGTYLITFSKLVNLNQGRLSDFSRSFEVTFAANQTGRLDVELRQSDFDFVKTVHEGKVILSWPSQNSAAYYVYRMGPDSSWNIVSPKDGSGVSSTTPSVIDTVDSAGTYIYKVEWFDHDDHKHYSSDTVHVKVDHGAFLPLDLVIFDSLTFVELRGGIELPQDTLGDYTIDIFRFDRPGAAPRKIATVSTECQLEVSNQQYNLIIRSVCNRFSFRDTIETPGTYFYRLLPYTPSGEPGDTSQIYAVEFDRKPPAPLFEMTWIQNVTSLSLRGAYSRYDSLTVERTDSASGAITTRTVVTSGIISDTLPEEGKYRYRIAGYISGLKSDWSRPRTAAWVDVPEIRLLDLNANYIRFRLSTSEPGRQVPIIVYRSVGDSAHFAAVDTVEPTGAIARDFYDFTAPDDTLFYAAAYLKSGKAGTRGIAVRTFYDTRLPAPFVSSLIDSGTSVALILQSSSSYNYPIAVFRLESGSRDTIPVDTVHCQSGYLSECLVSDVPPHAAIYNYYAAYINTNGRRGHLSTYRTIDFKAMKPAPGLIATSQGIRVRINVSSRDANSPIVIKRGTDNTTIDIVDTLIPTYASQSLAVLDSIGTPGLYFYRAYHLHNGKAGADTLISVYHAASLPPPRISSATAYPLSVGLTIYETSGMDSLFISRSTTISGSYARVQAVAVDVYTSSTVITSDVPAPGQYYFKVSGSVRGFTSAESPPYAVQVTGSMPSPVAPLNQTYSYSPFVQISLGYPSSSSLDSRYVDSIRIERGITSSGPFEVVHTFPYQSTSRYTFTDSTLRTGGTYYYRFKAIKGGLSSDFSPSTGVSFSPPLPAPSISSLVIEQSTDGSGVRLTWEGNSKVATYTIERARAGTTYISVGTVDAADMLLNYFDTNVYAGQTYNYRLRGSRTGSSDVYSTIRSIYYE